MSEFLINLLNPSQSSPSEISVYRSSLSTPSSLTFLNILFKYLSVLAALLSETSSFKLTDPSGEAKDFTSIE